MSRVIAVFCVVWAVALSGVHAQSPTPRIWQGVYSAAQAERGKTAYDTSCVRCHGADLAGTTAPALKGARFMETWGGENVSRLFEKIRDTMPPLFGTFVSDEAKLEIVAYILQTNAFPSGKADLAPADLNAIQILAKGADSRVQNFALVQVVGCLAREEHGWRLTQTGEAAATTAPTPTADALSQAAAKPLGTGSYRLLSAAPFDPASQLGQKVEARGLIYDEPGNARLTVTSLKSVGSACP
jgi:mono/diheme cytochrome c family protein